MTRLHRFATCVAGIVAAAFVGGCGASSTEPSIANIVGTYELVDSLAGTTWRPATGGSLILTDGHAYYMSIPAGPLQWNISGQWDVDPDFAAAVRLYSDPSFSLEVVVDSMRLSGADVIAAKGPTKFSFSTTGSVYAFRRSK